MQPVRWTNSPLPSIMWETWMSLSFTAVTSHWLRRGKNRNKPMETRNISDSRASKREHWVQTLWVYHPPGRETDGERTWKGRERTKWGNPCFLLCGAWLMWEWVGSGYGTRHEGNKGGLEGEVQRHLETCKQKGEWVQGRGDGGKKEGKRNKSKICLKKHEMKPNSSSGNKK